MELGQKVVEHLSMDTTYCVVHSEIDGRYNVIVDFPNNVTIKIPCGSDYPNDTLIRYCYYRAISKFYGELGFKELSK